MPSLAIAVALISGGFAFAVEGETTASASVAAGEPIDSGVRAFAAGTHVIDHDIAFENTVGFEPGADLRIAAGVTVTFKKGFHAEDVKIFSGDGKIAGVSKLTPEWFGAVGDGVTDDTKAMQRALDSFTDPNFGHAMPKINNVLLLRKNYLLSSVKVDTTYLNIHAENAWLIARDDGNHPYLIQFNRHFCSITGRLSIEGNYNLGYECMVNVNTRHFIGNNIVIWRASLAWLIGDRTWASSDEPGAGEKGVSENVISNSSTTHCLRGVEAVGSNTIVTFANCFIYSYPWTLPKDSPRKEAWESADSTLVRTIGACIYFTGGGLANFNARVPLVEVQPIKTTKPQYFSNYGIVRIFNAHVEGGNFFAAVNPKKIPTQDHQGNKVKQVGVSFSMVSCGGYVGGARVPINTDPMFTGTILVENCTFHGDRAETFARIGNPEAVIKVDNFSLRDKWSNGLSAIEGGTTLFEDRLILDVRHSDQMVTGEGVGLAFQKPLETNDTGHFLSNYNKESGVFVVPTGGLDNVNIVAGIHVDKSDAAGESQLTIIKNGVEVGKQPLPAATGTIRHSFSRLEPGDEISIMAFTDVAPKKLSGGDRTYLQITASRH